MSVEDDEVLFSMGEGCMAHGDEFMRECATCGTEFCAKCFPGSAVCAECSDEPDDDLDDVLVPDDDAAVGDDLLGEDLGEDEEEEADDDRY